MTFDVTSIRYFLKEHGKTLTLRKRSAGEYDVVTGTVGHTTTDYSVYGLLAGTSPLELTDTSLVNSVGKIIISAKQVDGTALPTPDINDQIIDGVNVFNVLKVFDPKTHNTNICYTLICRG